MTGWAADRHITPRVIAHLADNLPDVPRKHRPSLVVAQCVLRAQARWARREPNGEHAGMWLADDTVGQLQANTAIPPGTIRNALRALELIGLNVTVRNGGGKGEHARGALRRLVLDPVDNADTARAKPAEYRPVLRVPEHAQLDPVLRVPEHAQLDPVLRVLGTDTPRATARTPRAQARDTASSAFTTYPRVGKADAGFTAITVDLAGLKPSDVIRCPNQPARRNAWCHATCELCHGMGHIHAEQLGVT